MRSNFLPRSYHYDEQDGKTSGTDDQSNLDPSLQNFVSTSDQRSSHDQVSLGSLLALNINNSFHDLESPPSEFNMADFGLNYPQTHPQPSVNTGAQPRSYVQAEDQIFEYGSTGLSSQHVATPPYEQAPVVMPSSQIPYYTHPLSAPHHTFCTSVQKAPVSAGSHDGITQSPRPSFTKADSDYSLIGLEAVPHRAPKAKSKKSLMQDNSKPSASSKPTRREQKHAHRSSLNKPTLSRSPSGSPPSQTQDDTQPRLKCRICAETCEDLGDLEDHIRIGHNRPFTCIFHEAGCQSSFTTKNEWKRHVNAQHLKITYYLCLDDACARFDRGSRKVCPIKDPTFGKIFNRKDLYDSHIKRMHRPVGNWDDSKNQWSRHIENLRDRARRKRCSLPQQMECPANDCLEQFWGDKAWEERLEHIARHMERAAAGDELPVRFGEQQDRTFWTWAATQEASIIRRTPSGWELCSAGGRRNSMPKPREGSLETESTEGDEDAEGSDC